MNISDRVYSIENKRHMPEEIFLRWIGNKITGGRISTHAEKEAEKDERFKTRTENLLSMIRKQYSPDQKGWVDVNQDQTHDQINRLEDAMSGFEKPEAQHGILQGFMSRPFLDPTATQQEAQDPSILSHMQNLANIEIDKQKQIADARAQGRSNILTNDQRNAMTGYRKNPITGEWETVTPQNLLDFEEAMAKVQTDAHQERGDIDLEDEKELANLRNRHSKELEELEFNNEMEKLDQIQGDKEWEEYRDGAKEELAGMGSISKLNQGMFDMMSPPLYIRYDPNMEMSAFQDAVSVGYKQKKIGDDYYLIDPLNYDNVVATLENGDEVDKEGLEERNNQLTQMAQRAVDYFNSSWTKGYDQDLNKLINTYGYFLFGDEVMARFPSRIDFANQGEYVKAVNVVDWSQAYPDSRLNQTEFNTLLGTFTQFLNAPNARSAYRAYMRQRQSFANKARRANKLIDDLNTRNPHADRVGGFDLQLPVPSVQKMINPWIEE